MAVERAAHDQVINDLHAELVRAADLTEGCSVVLERLALACGAGRAVLIVRTEQGSRGAVWGLPPAHVRPIIQDLTASGSTALDILNEGSAPVLLPAGTLPPLGFGTCAAFTFHGLDERVPLGIALVEAPEISPAVREFARLADAIGPALARVAQIEELTGRAKRFARQRDLLTTIVNTMPDPVILTDVRNDIILANRRAELLFSSTPEDSEGRRRAIQINNLLFSSFLTQTVISDELPAARELNLVDTDHGSDLLFEVLSVRIDVAGQEGTISVLRDITDLRHAVNELEVQFNRSRIAEHDARRERDRLNVVLENVSDPILVTDERTNIVLMNPEADRLFVVDDQSGTRQQRRQIQANDTRFTTLVNNFMLRDELRQVERIAIVDPGTGRDFPVEVASSKILNPRGEPIAIVSVIHDLTQAEDNERLARELQQLNDELEDRIRRATVELEERNSRLEWQSFELQKASRLKSEFLANMSHELRTPINVILGYTSLMREEIYGSLTEQQDQALKKTYATSQHLLDLINDILDLSKIEAGKMQLHVEPVRLQEIMAELSESVEPMLRAKGLDYETFVADGLPPLSTDRTKLKQILLNLISNAIKFTSEGKVSVTVEPAASGVTIRVSDTGIGIRPEDLDSIFDDFRQIDQSHTREFGGTGLGLSITRKLLTLLGGKVQVESAYGHGATFVVELPDLAAEGAPRSVPTPG